MKKLLVLVIAGILTLHANSQLGLEGIIVETYYISDAADSADAADNFASYPLAVGSTTYRVYADLLPGYKLIQIFGTQNHPLTIATTTSFYNDPNYGFSVYQGTSVNNTKKRTTLIDSYISMGGVANGLMGVLKEEDTDGTIGNIHGLLLNNDPLAGSPVVGDGGLDGLMPGTAILPNVLGITNELDIFDQTAGANFTTTGGAIAVLGGIEGITSNNRILIGQFTTDGEFSFSLNLQIATPIPGQSQIFVAGLPQSGENYEATLNYPTAVIESPPGLEAVLVEKYYIADSEDEANAAANGAAYPLNEGTTTYRVYANLLPGYKVNQLFGNNNHALEVSTTTSFYNDALNGFDVYEGTSIESTQTNTTLLDSYLTLGGVASGLSGVPKNEDVDGTIGNLQGILNNDNVNAGIPITGTNGKDGLMSGNAALPSISGFTNELEALDQTPGSGFVTTTGSISSTSGAQGITASNHILLGQFTTDGIFSFKLNLKLFTPLPGEVQTYVAENSLTGELLDSTLTYDSDAPVASPNGLEGIIVEKYYISDTNDMENASTNGATYPLNEGSITYRVYADLLPGYKVQQLFGNANHELHVETSTSFYNDALNGFATFNATSVANTQVNTTLIDSYITLGGVADGLLGVLKIEDTNGSIGNSNGILINSNPDAGAPLNGANGVDGLMPGTTGVPVLNGITNELQIIDQTPGSILSINNGSIAIMEGVEGATLENRVLLGQFTTDGDFSFDLNLSLLTPVPNEVQTFVASNPQTGEIVESSLSYAIDAPVVSPPGLEGIVVEKYYVSDLADSLNASNNSSTSPLNVGSVTYRVYADLLPNYKVSHLFGSASHPLELSTTSTFYNDPTNGFVTYEGTSVANTQANTTLIDSYLAMGGVAEGLVAALKTEDTDGTIGNTQGILQNDDEYAGIPIMGTNGADGLMPGIPITPFLSGFTNELGILDQTSGSGFSTSNGTVYALDGASGITPSNHVLLGQFTTKGTLSFNFNLVLFTPVIGETQTFVASNPVSGEVLDTTLSYTSPPYTVSVFESESFTANNFRIYPNPCAEEFTLVQNRNESGKSKITIVDITGQVVYESYCYNVMQKIDTASLSKGIYTIRLENEISSNALKFIKQ
jgi:hypothetical protein